MNKTIKNIATTSTNDNVLSLAAKLIGWGNKRVKVCFTKKDGSVRNMICVPNNAWNAMNGISDLTTQGKKMLATKLSRGIVTVTEVLKDGTFAPRSFNLNKVISLELVK